MKKHILVLMLVSMLSACASTSSFDEQVEQLHQAAIAQGHRVEEMVFVRIPSAGNPISNGMILASLATGASSTAVEALTEVLIARPKNKPLGIIGDSHELNIATLKRALKDLPTSTDKPEYSVYLNASSEQLADLQKIAEGKNIRVYGLK